MSNVRMTDDEFSRFMQGVESFWEVPRGKCLLCGKTPPVVALEGHHIFPQCCGGEDLPVVDLCGDHHALVHSMARSALLSAKRGSDIQFCVPAGVAVDLQVLRSLVQIIVVAEYNPIDRKRKLAAMVLSEDDWVRLHNAVARMRTLNIGVNDTKGVVVLALRRLFDDMGL